MFGAWCTLPSPGSRIRFWMYTTTQPRSSSTTCQSLGKCGIALPGYVDIVDVIHAAISSRPLNRP